ncbi:MAG: NAD-binding protein, partial [Eubacterium sp.]|nr:NAD-binding protein [Eubacterium sp.]
MTQAEKYVQTIKGKKIAFVGMGVANAPCAEFLAKHGVEVYACDKRDKDYIGAEICEKLEKLGVKFSLGENYLDILPDMDIVFRSHGILPFQNEWIGQCIERGQKVTTEMEVFFEYCSCKIYAITGSNGKTT